MDGTRRYSGKLTWGNAVVDVLLGGFFLGLSIGFGFFLITLIPGLMIGSAGLKAVAFWIGGAGAFIGAIIWGVLAVVFPFLALVGWIINSFLIWIMAKILGGKSSFSEQTIALGSIVAGPVMTLSALVAWIPFIGGFLVGLIGLYSWYTQTIVIRETNNFSTLRAVISWVTWIVIDILFVLLLLYSFIASTAVPSTLVIQSSPGY